MFHFLHLLILLLLLSAKTTYAQEPQYFKYDTGNGLPSTEVYDAYEDRNGYLWFTTDRGIARYDGYSFTIFTTKDGLTNNTNFRIVEDSRGAIYFSSMDGTVNRFYKGTFKCIHKIEQPDEAETRGAENIYVDNADNLYLYYNNYKQQQYYYKVDTAGRRLKLPITSPRVNLTVTDSDNRILMSINGKISLQTVLIGGEYYSLNKSKDSSLYKIHSSLKSINRIRTGHIIISIYKDNNDLWLCTANGLVRYLNADFNAKPELYFTGIITTSIIRDHEGHYWVTTLQNGVIEIPDLNVRTLQFPGKNRLPKIQKLAPNENELAVSIQNGGVWLIDSLMNRRCILDMEVYNKSLIWQNKNRLIGHDLILNRQSGSYRWQYKKGGGYALQVLSNEHIIWAHSQGIDIRMNDSNIISVDSIGLHHSTFCAFQDKKQRIWIGTGKGMWLSSTQHYDFRKYNKPAELAETRINVIKEHPGQDILLIGTMGKGVVSIDPTSGDYSFITEAQGLISNLVHSILPVNDSTVYIGTNRGLSFIKFRINKNIIEVRSIRNFTVADGLSSNYINDLAIWRNHLWVATDKGITYFPMSSIAKVHQPPHIHIDSISVAGRSVARPLNNLTFNYNENDITIYFTGISKSKPVSSTFYRYKISTNHAGSDHWVYTNNRTLNLFGLNPEAYHFEIQARNKDNVWSRPAHITFTITPHFTQTAWFRLIAIVAIAGTVMLLIYLRTRFLKQRQTEAELLHRTEMKLKSAELDVLRGQMNPHFLYNALNAIQNFIFKKDFLLANNYITSFAKLMRDTLHHSEKGWITIDNEHQFLLNYLSLEKMRFSDRFNFKFHIDEALTKDNYYIPALMIQPLLENAVKHAFRNTGRMGQLSVHFKRLNAYAVRIAVRDNGIGINNAAKKTNTTSKGLKIVKERIELLDGEHPLAKPMISITDISDTDTSNSGTIIEMVLPMLNMPPAIFTKHNHHEHKSKISDHR